MKQAHERRGAAAAPAAAISGGGALNLLPWPTVDFAKFGPVEARPLSRIKKISGANLARNWVMIPHVTQFDEADITELEALRVALNKENEKAGIKVTMLAFLIKACVAALKKFPDFNASLDGDNLVLQAVLQHRLRRRHAERPRRAGDQGTPTRRACSRSRRRWASSRRRRAKASSGRPTCRAAASRSRSLGGIGGTAFTPIINAPEVAILGVSKSATKPVWDGKAVRAAADAAAVAVVRPPRDRRRGGGAVQRRIYARRLTRGHCARVLRRCEAASANMTQDERSRPSPARRSSTSSTTRGSASAPARPRISSSTSWRRSSTGSRAPCRARSSRASG